MDEREDSDAEAWLQLKPVEPLPSQCCGSGCSPCVFDLYYRDLERWEAARARNDRSLLSGKQSSKTQGCSTKLSPEIFLAFHISAIEKLTKDTYHVRFTLPGSSQLGLHPGQHLILRGTADGLEIQRAYTPISPVTAEGYFDVLIKCYRTGLMSRYVESWRIGDTAFWRGPFGSFLYEPNKYGELLMLAAGTGLAPMVPILQSITDNADDETFVTLVGCFKTFESIYLKTFLQEQARFWNVRTFFVLSQVESSLTCLVNINSSRKCPSQGMKQEAGVQLRGRGKDLGQQHRNPTKAWARHLANSPDCWLALFPSDLNQMRNAWDTNGGGLPEQLPWSYREKTRFGRLGQELLDELVARCRRKPFTLVCGSPEFTEDMARCLLSAGLTKDSYFLF